MWIHWNGVTHKYHILKQNHKSIFRAVWKVKHFRNSPVAKMTSHCRFHRHLWIVQEVGEHLNMRKWTTNAKTKKEAQVESPDVSIHLYSPTKNINLGSRLICKDFKIWPWPRRESTIGRLANGKGLVCCVVSTLYINKNNYNRTFEEFFLTSCQNFIQLFFSHYFE